jgi:hypothetical protein
MPDQPKMSDPKKFQSKNFNAERATRLSLLAALCLTAGIGTGIYAPLAHFKPANLKPVKATAQTVPALAVVPVRAEQVQYGIPAQPLTPRPVPVLSSAESPAGSTLERPIRAALAPTAPRDNTEDGESDDQSGSVPVARLVRVVQPTSGLPGPAITTAGPASKKVGARRLVRQVTSAPAVTRPRLAPPAAVVSRPAVPKIVRRPATPVIAATAPS